MMALVVTVTCAAPAVAHAAPGEDFTIPSRAVYCSELIAKIACSIGSENSAGQRWYELYETGRVRRVRIKTSVTLPVPREESYVHAIPWGGEFIADDYDVYCRVQPKWGIRCTNSDGHGFGLRRGHAGIF